MRALATFAIGEECERLLEVSLPTFKTYAERHEYELIVGTPSKCPRPPSWMKVPLLYALLETYSEVLWLDCDVVVVNADRDVADDVPLDDWHALVRHYTPDGEVPNCGVWLVRSTMRETLATIWEIGERFVSHPWWEQAALLELLGYRGLPVRFEHPTELYARTCWLDLEWNSHEERDRHEQPNFAHATAGSFEWRLDVMHHYAERSKSWVSTS